MLKPTFRGIPQAILAKVTLPEINIQLWQWMHAHIIRDIDIIHNLVESGYQPLEEDNKHIYACFMSQGYDVAYVFHPSSNQPEMWARAEDLQRVKQCPILLAFQVDALPLIQDIQLPDATNTDIITIPMLQFLPPAQIGEYGLADSGNKSTIYNIAQLPEDAQALWHNIGSALVELAAPGDWFPFREWPLIIAAHPDTYNKTRNELQTGLLQATGKERDDIQARLEALEAAHQQIQNVRDAQAKPDWIHQWEKIRGMIRDLSSAYWNLHQSQQKQTSRNRGLPPLTSAHSTTLPSVNHFRGLAQSFGPAIQPDLWNEETGSELRLFTPNNSMLSIRGENEQEHKALHHYIMNIMGVEGLKHMIVLLDSYYVQTGGKDRKQDARVSLRQLLIRMGAGSKADDPEEQGKLMHSILYFARTWVTSNETRYVETPKRKGRKKSEGTEYTPLLVIEAMKATEDGGIRIPTEVEYHLGKDYFEYMYGEHKQFFTLPTAQLLSYHATREQQELCLAFYLSNLINVSGGRKDFHFPTLLTQSGLQLPEDIKKDIHRTRAALRVLYALERLEKDGWINRAKHHDIDIALAIELATKSCKKDDVSEATYQRIVSSYSYLQGLSISELRTKRRQALQHLLDTIKDNAISFTAGPLLNEQAEKREKQRQAAIGRNEQTQIARVMKAAKKEIMNIAQEKEQAE